MKFVFLSLFVLFAAAPAQAAGCDMHDGQETPQGQHHGMHEDAQQNHAGSAMDCCDEDTDRHGEACLCAPASHCPTSGNGLAGLAPATAGIIHGPTSVQWFASPAIPPPRWQDTPPLRPPITG